MKSSFRVAGFTITVVLSALCLGLSAAPVELLINPGFEMGNNRTPWDDTIAPTGWLKEGNWGWAGWKQSGKFPSHTGTKYVDAGAFNAGQFGTWSQNLPAVPGSQYTVSVWSRIEGWETSPRANMRLEFRNGGTIIATDILDIYTGSCPSPNVWTRYSFTSRVTPEGTTSVRFCLTGQHTGTAMFDDASVTVTEPPANPDFNRDGVIDLLDFEKLSQSWRTVAGQSAFDPNYDVAKSGSIDIHDLRTFAEKWMNWNSYITIHLTETAAFQSMEGFGASLTDSSAHLIMTAMSAEQRNALMRDLFDPDEGIGLSFLRQPMGSSDFRLADYTYDDMPAGHDDPNLSHFSIAHDYAEIIPLLKQARQLNPDLFIMASPWSAPAWMKTSGSLFHGSLIDSDEIYETYAEYFVRFLLAYEAEGLHIDAVTLQNEPHYEPYAYPGMRMEPADQIRLAIALGPKLAANNLTTRIIVWDHNWDNPAYAITVLNNSEAKSYIAGTAFHAYAGDVSAQMTVFNAHPDRDIYFTECSGGDWASGFFDNLKWDISKLMINSVRYRAKTVAKWNLALDPERGPKIPGGCSNCRGVITIDPNGVVTREEEYYALGHASKFVRRGARQIASTLDPGNSIENVAFLNPDGSRIILVLNPNAFRQYLQIESNGRAFFYPLLGQSITTFHWPAGADAEINVWITTSDQSLLLRRQNSTRAGPYIPAP